MRRILFICSLYHPHVGGAETMIREMAQFYLKQNIEVVILTKRWPTELATFEKIEGVSVYRIFSAKTDKEFIDVTIWLKNNEEKIKSDIIHVIGMRRPMPFIAQILGSYWKVPVICTVAGGDIPDKNDPYPGTVWEESKSTVYPALLACDQITCVSKAIEKDFRELFPEISGNKIETIYAGIDIPLIASIKAKKPYKNYLYSFRRLDPTKGIHILIGAFNIIQNKFPEFHLVISGDGSERKKLENLSSKYNLNKRIHFTGQVNLLDGISLLKGAFATVVPSLSEAGGLVNIEAQAAGCPVVASRVGGIPEYVQDGVSGLLFESKNLKDLADKVKTIISNAHLRNKLIQGGIEHAKKFSWDILGPQYLALYNKVIDKKQVEPFQPWSNLTKRLWLKLKE